MEKKKLRIGWFSFTCCEDSTIVFTELLNTNYRQWIKNIDFVHFKTIQTKNKWRQMDVAFVEGAIASSSQEERLLKIRSLANKLVAVGACACSGMPSSQRNSFPPQKLEGITPLLQKFGHAQNVRTVAQCVKVDDRINGCPMTETQFLQVLNKYLIDFGITK